MPFRLPQKLLLVMKITTFILMIALVQVSAKGFGQRITLNEKNTPLGIVLKAIKLQSGYDFFYNSRDINGKNVTVKLTDASVDEAIRAAIAGLPLSYKILKNNIVLTRIIPHPAKSETPGVNLLILIADTVRIRGIVTDSAGKPLDGATLFLVRNSVSKDKGTTVYVLGKGGMFDVVANVGDNLIFSYVGYALTSFIATKDVPFKYVVLGREAKQLDEVLVSTGFQTRSKERATGSFSKADMEIFSKRTGTMDIVSRLEGQIPGLQLAIGSNNTNIDPNGSGVETRKSIIRGTSSIQTSTTPLYVVNGVAVPDFNSVNADDIEDITVLKDAAASAIWGARSANGVIVIKTKSGSRNERLSISYSGFVNYSGRPDLNNKKMLTSAQYIQVAKDIFNPVANPWESQSFIAPHDQILYDQYRHIITGAVASRKLDSLASINNTSQIRELLTQPAYTVNHTVSASGGNNVYGFYASMGYSGGQGTEPGSSNNNYRLNFTQSITPGKRVRISLNTSLANNISSAKNPVSISGGFLPYQLFRDASGNNLNMNYMNGYIDSLTRDYQARSRVNLNYSPLDELNLAKASNNNLNVNVTANVAVKLWKGLSFSGAYGYVKSHGTSTNYFDHGTIDQRRLLVSLTQANTVNDVPIYNYPTTGGSYTTNNSEQYNWTVRNQLVYEAAVRNGKDHILLQAGQELQEQSATGNSTNVLGYDDALGTYSTLDYEKLRAGIFPTVSGFGYYSYTPFTITKTLSRFKSYFGLASYTFDNKYSVDGSWRQDYSNQFASDISTQKRPIWSLGGKWRISQEGFMHSLKWLNDLNLRATYGITGNSPGLDAAPRLDILRPLSAANTYNYNLTSGDAYTIGTVGNKTLAWETTTNLNIGTDFSILHRRISGGIDVYNRVTTDLIGRTSGNPLSGYTNLTGNIGKLLNKGIEVSIHSDNIVTGNFNWSTSLTMGFNKNKLASYSTPTSATNLISTRFSGAYVIGYPVGPLWAYRFAGLDNMGDPKIYLANNTVTKNPTIATVKDLVYMGSTIPAYSGGFSNNFTYKRITLALNMIYNLGAVMRRDVNSFYSGKLANTPTFSSGNISSEFLDRWQKPGDEAFTNIPSFVSDQVANSRRNTSYYTASDINVISASYIKLRDITLSYTLKSNILHKLDIQHASLFLQTGNFMVWRANHYGIDPEVPSQSTGAPVIRHSYSLGANVSF